MTRLRAMRDTLAYDLLILAICAPVAVAALILLTVTMPGVR